MQHAENLNSRAELVADLSEPPVLLIPPAMREELARLDSLIASLAAQIDSARKEQQALMNGFLWAGGIDTRGLSAQFDLSTGVVTLAHDPKP